MKIQHFLEQNGGLRYRKCGDGITVPFSLFPSCPQYSPLHLLSPHQPKLHSAQLQLIPMSPAPSLFARLFCIMQDFSALIINLISCCQACLPPTRSSRLSPSDLSCLLSPTTYPALMSLGFICSPGSDFSAWLQLIHCSLRLHHRLVLQAPDNSLQLPHSCFWLLLIAPNILVYCFWVQTIPVADGGCVYTAFRILLCVKTFCSLQNTWFPTR